MATLSDVTTNVTNMIRRSDLSSEATAEIGNAIRHYSRRASWVIERRNGTITTVASQTWYSTVDNSASIGVEDSPTGTTPTSTDDAVDMLEIIFAKIEQGAVDWPLDFVGYREFENLIQNNTVSGTPTFITRFADQIGLWPTPDDAFTVYLSATWKPIVPTADAHESVWFDQYRELIENSAARRIASKWLQDEELTRAFLAAEQEQEGLLLAEGMRRQKTGKLRLSSVI